MPPQERPQPSTDFHALVLSERALLRPLLDYEISHVIRITDLQLAEQPDDWIATWFRARVQAGKAELRWRKQVDPGELEHQRQTLAEWIASAKARVDIAEEICLGHPGKPGGRGQWQILCPLHGDKRPSLSVDTIRGVWYCFGCQASGDILTWWQMVDGLTWRQVLDRLEARSGIARPVPTTRVRGFVLE